MRTYEAFQQGVYYMENGDYESAIECFDRVIAEEPGTILSYKYRGDCHFQTKLYAEASTDYGIAIANSIGVGMSTDHDLHYKCACAYLAQGNFSAAAQHFYASERNIR